MEFYERVKKARLEQGISEKQIASFVGISKSHYRHFEKNFRGVSLWIADAFCYYLGEGIPIGKVCDEKKYCPTPCSFQDLVRKKLEEYGGSIVSLSRASQISYITLYRWTSYDNSIHMFLSSADFFLKNMNMIYVFGGGYNCPDLKRKVESL